MKTKKRGKSSVTIKARLFRQNFNKKEFWKESSG
jgi:hypothetical protein